uniref:Nuclear receptor n=1 Tax=Pristionchus pacificus TaxID=54126 RepID=A0A8R1Y5U6_PRIPA
MYATWPQNPSSVEVVDDVYPYIWNEHYQHDMHQFDIVADDSPSTSESIDGSEDGTGPVMKKAESPKICAVCGDKASGLNYEVPSCYGCKSFFRRTLQNQKRFECSNGGQCKAALSKAARLHCRSCRFDRCVELGMNPLALVHEVLRQQRQQERNPPSSLYLVPMTRPVECKYDRIIEEMIHLDEAHQRLRRSQYNPYPNTSIDVEWCLIGPSRMGIDFGDMPLVYPPHPLHGPFLPLQVRIRDRIPFPNKPHTLPPTYKKWVMVDLIYTIEWIKTFAFFNQLEEKEKLQLVKNVTQMVTILAAAFYSYEVRRSDVTVMPDGQILIEGDLPKEATIERANNFEIIKRFKSIQMDKKEYVLLKAIMACDPDHDCFCLESRRALQSQRELFSRSLMSYVLARRGPTKGPPAFTQMLSILTWQQRVVQKYKDCYLLLTALDLQGPWLPKIMLEVYSN